LTALHCQIRASPHQSGLNAQAKWFAQPAKWCARPGTISDVTDALGKMMCALMLRAGGWISDEEVPA